MGLLKRIWRWLCSLFGGGRKRETDDLDRYVRQMQEALLSMKAQTEAVQAAQEKRAREIARCEEEIRKMERYAAKAAGEDRDDEARFFLEKKASLSKELLRLTSARDMAAGYTAQAENLCNKAQAQLSEITARKDAVKAKLAAAELMESMNRLNEGQAGSSLSGLEAGAQAAMDRAEAMAELEGRTGGSELEALMNKYDGQESMAAGTEDPTAAKSGRS